MVSEEARGWISAVKSKEREAENGWINGGGQIPTGNPRERVSPLQSKSGSGQRGGGIQIFANHSAGWWGGGGEEYSVTPFPGIIGDPCGSGSLMARYRTVPLLDNRQILLFMNVAGPSSCHRQRISLSFVDYTRCRFYGDCRLQSRPWHVSKIVFRETICWCCRSRWIDVKKAIAVFRTIGYNTSWRRLKILQARYNIENHLI